MNLNLSQNPVNEYLGPGLGGLWTGEQRAMDVAQNQQTQMKTLEDIAGMQQKRQFEAQMQPHTVEKARLGNVETQQKLDKTSYDQFLSEMSQLAPGLQSVEQIETLRKKHNVPAEHPAFQTAVTFFNQGKLNEYMDKVASSDPKSRDTRATELAKEKLAQDAQTARLRLENERQDAISKRQAATDASRERIAALRGHYQQAAAAVRANSPRNQNLNQLMASLFSKAFSSMEGGKSDEAIRALNQIQLIQRQLDDAERNKQVNRADAEVAILRSLGMPVQESPRTIMNQQPPAAAPPPAGPSVDAMPGVPTAPQPGTGAPPAAPQKPPQRWGRDAQGNPIRIQ
jgi:hypothetical protein